MKNSSVLRFLFVLCGSLVLGTPVRAEFTSLHDAAAHGTEYTDVISFLDAGADVNGIQAYGITPLHRAAKNPHPEITEALIASGADPNARTNDQAVPLLWAAVDGSNPLVLQMLADAGADVNAKDDMGRTPIFFAVGVSNADAAAMLIEAGAELNLVDAEGRHLLSYAKNSKISDLLKENSAR